VEGGLTSDEMIDLAQDLEKLGADYISLSDGGGYEECNHLITSAVNAEHAPDTAAKFKKALKIPVILPSQMIRSRQTRLSRTANLIFRPWGVSF
jgi:2,4-dienoyl-CoA reductase-like NADH-dependent reductase (Old Yellow Enzyme family)